MAYEKTYTKPYTDGWKNLPEETTPIKAEILNAMDNAFVAVEEQLEKTTAIFDDESGSVLSGNSDKTIKPTKAGIFGNIQTVTSSAMYSVIAGFRNVVKAGYNLICGTTNTINDNATNNVVSGTSNTLSDSATNNAVSGYNNVVSGKYNVVGGKGNSATAESMSMVGEGLKTYSTNYGAQQVAGQYNAPEEVINTGKKILFGVGNGSSDTSRSNAMLLDEEGNLQVSGKIFQNGGEEVGGGSEGAKQSAVYDSYSSAISALNDATNTDFEIGQTIRISASGYPDLWIVSVETTQVSYTYSGKLVTDIKSTGKVQIGYYYVSLVEADSFYPSSITLQHQDQLIYYLQSYTDSQLENIKLGVGQTVHITNSACVDYYIYSKEKTAASYTSSGNLEGDIIAAGGLLQIGYYKIGMVKGYVGALSYDETLALLNAE